jgi:putative FmdB family regulatory protein
MPLYEYECEAENGRRFEIIQKFSDEPLAVCPTCGGKVRRLISSPAIQFKGSGWYITDYARKSGSDAGREAKESKDSKESKESKESKGTGSSSTSSTESSPSTPAANSAPASSTPAKKD